MQFKVMTSSVKTLEEENYERKIEQKSATMMHV